MAANAQPSTNPGHIKLGLDYLTPNIDMQLHADVKTGQTEFVLSRKECSGFHWGGTAIVDWKHPKYLKKYDFAVKGEPVKNFMVGLKHLTVDNKETIAPGKFMFYLFNQNTLNKWASEFTYDW